MLDVWLVAWGREKLTFGELPFAPFVWIRLGWYLQTISVFEELEKSSQRKSQRKTFLFFRIDDSEQCRTQNNVQHCRVALTVTRTAVVGGKRHLRLGFVFPTEKSSTPSFGCSGFVFAVFCHRLTATSGMHSLVRHRKLPLMFSSPSFDYQTWWKGSLPGGWRHTRTLAIVVRPRPSKSVPFVFRNTCVTQRSTVTGCRQKQVLRVLSDLYPIS